MDRKKFKMFPKNFKINESNSFKNAIITTLANIARVYSKCITSVTVSLDLTEFDGQTVQAIVKHHFVVVLLGFS